MTPEQLDRALGCWLGQLSGDALGSMVESQSTEQIRARWPHGLRDMGLGETWGTLAGQPSDDSELGMELAYALQESYPGFDPNVVAFHYRNWRDSQPFSCEETMAQALAGHFSVALSSMAASVKRQADGKSLTNGALMRQSPLGIWGYAMDPSAVAECARLDARLTHPHPICVEASAVYVATLARTIKLGLSSLEAYEFALEFQGRHGQEPDVLEGIRLARDPEALPPYSSQAGPVLLTLHNAFYQLLHGPDVETVVVETVMLGGGAGITAAVAGALAGAVYGRGAIPLRWIEAIDECFLDPEAEVKQPRPERYWPGHYEMLVRALLGVPEPRRPRARFGA